VKKLLELIGRCVKICTQRPRDLRHVLGMANFAAGQIADPEADTRCFPVVEWRDICDKNFPLHFYSFPNIGASISLQESAALVALLKSVGAKRVFEFGTYKGVSTTQIALNLAEDGQIYTLDLPEDQSSYSLQISKESERAIAREEGKGTLIPKDLLSKISFLRIDSARFDPKPFEGSMDLVFVDGAHSSDYIENDTQKGWQMLRRGGVMVWHDCTPSHRDVVHFLKGFNPLPKRVAGTTLAFVFKPN